MRAGLRVAPPPPSRQQLLNGYTRERAYHSLYRLDTLETFMRLALLIAITTVISGCASTYTQEVLMVPSAKLARGKSIIIATPSNGQYGNTVYSASGAMTALATKAAFARFSNEVTISPACRDIPCLKSGSAAPFDYYVLPEILHWEDRATEWSGIPDRIEIKLGIYDVKGKELATTLIYGKSKWLTFGGDHPQDLLQEPLNSYIDSLY